MKWLLFFPVPLFLLAAGISIFFIHWCFDTQLICDFTLFPSFSTGCLGSHQNKTSEKRVLEWQFFPQSHTLTTSRWEHNGLSGVVTVINHSSPCMLLDKGTACSFSLALEIAKGTGGYAVHTLAGHVTQVCVCVCWWSQLVGHQPVVLNLLEGGPVPTGHLLFYCFVRHT